jgi:hypothetical protein
MDCPDAALTVSVPASASLLFAYSALMISLSSNLLNYSSGLSAFTVNNQNINVTYGHGEQATTLLGGARHAKN